MNPTTPMTIPPELLKLCAAEGDAAALHALNGSSAMYVNPEYDSDQDAREAFAAAAIETYLAHTVDGYDRCYPTLAAMTAERDALQARLAQMDWRPVSVRPTAEDCDEDGDVTVGWGEICCTCSVDIWPPQKATHWMPFTPPPADPFEQWWKNATEAERRTAAQRNWESNRASKGGAM
jgi:hypothetical protein